MPDSSIADFLSEVEGTKSSNAAVPQLHLAIPVAELEPVVSFFVEVFGCGVGRVDREHGRWADLDFFGHQVVPHVDEEAAAARGTNSVDGRESPSLHFGPILDPQTYDEVVGRLEARDDIEWITRPTVRWEGRLGEHRMCFLKAPGGCCAIELKAFTNREGIFAPNPE